MKSKARRVAEVQEGVTIIEVLEIEEIALAGEALTTSMEEVVSEVRAGVEVVTIIM